MSNPLIYQNIIIPPDGTAAAPSIQVGGSPSSSSGVGMYGDYSSIKFSVGSANVASIGAAGISGAGSVDSIRVFTSAASVGGGATETFTVTGLLSTDTILSVSQSIPGSNSLPLLGYNTLANNSLKGVYSADPGTAAKIVVCVKR